MVNTKNIDAAPQCPTDTIMDEEERPRKLQKLDPSIRGNSTGISPSLQDTAFGNPTGINARPRPNASSAPTTDRDPDTESADGHGDSHTTPGPAPQLPVSKKQLKKERKKRMWEEGREERKAKRKEKQAEKRRRKYLEKAGESTTPTGIIGTSNSDSRADNSPDPTTSAAPPSSRRPFLTPIAIILDCGFDELMLEKEIVSLSNQVTRSYSENRRSIYRTQLIVSSFNGRMRERFETILAKAYLGWTAASFVEDDFVVAAEQARDAMRERMKGWRLHGPLGAAAHAGTATEDPREATHSATEGEIIYLTSDSEHTLTHLSPYSTYIVGGIVDRNRHKGICYKRAMDRGVRTAKLPIGDYLNMASRFVLATNHVVEIMLRWLECGDWAEAFSRVIPKRKGGVLKKQSGIAGSGEAREAQSLVEGVKSECDEGMEEAEAEGVSGEQDSIDEGGDFKGGTPCTNEDLTRHGAQDANQEMTVKSVPAA
ncbi:MAG: tRNA (guanine(9)-N(1))-methyltransferase [Geoglossum simile]|nr:MAG: tRNA (guanine(9)-N(1))-methyltransferase [Geoglossum simile]